MGKELVSAFHLLWMYLAMKGTWLLHHTTIKQITSSLLETPVHEHGRNVFAPLGMVLMTCLFLAIFPMFLTGWVLQRHIHLSKDQGSDHFKGLKANPLPWSMVRMASLLRLMVVLGCSYVLLQGIHHVFFSLEVMVLCVIAFEILVGVLFWLGQKRVLTSSHL